MWRSTDNMCKLHQKARGLVRHARKTRMSTNSSTWSWQGEEGRQIPSNNLWFWRLQMTLRFLSY